MGRPQRHPRHRGGPVRDPARQHPPLSALPGARPSPNIWHHPEVYERENHAFDRDGLVWAVMREVHDWTGLDVLDIGCGTGFHLPTFAATARGVTGIEPHAALAALARRRTRRLPGVQVHQALAQDLPLASASIDVAHARWAYFFGSGAEPGLRELDRVMRRGGAAFVIDNDAERSTFGRWFARGFPDVAPTVDFWTRRGWQRERVSTSWRFEDRADLESVVRIELPGRVAEEALAEHRGLEVDYAVNVWWHLW